MRILFLILLLIVHSSALAADLEIRVFEKGTGRAIADAVVVIEKTEQYSETNAQGQATIEDVNLPVRLKILSSGYDTLFKNAATTDKSITVYLEPLSIESDAVVVTAERIEEKTSKVTLSVEEIRSAPGTGGDPLNIIETLPGVVVASGGGGGPPGGGYYVRGSDQNENAVWVNRTPIGYLYHFGGIYSTINPQLLSDFNIFLGGYPVEYNDVLGGILDVKLRPPRKDRLRQNYSIGTYQSSILLEGPIGKQNGDHGFFFSARRSYIDFLLSPETLTSLIQDEDDKNKPENQKNSIVQVPVFHDIQAIWEYNSPIGLLRTSYFQAHDEFAAVFNENRILDPQSAGDFDLAAGYRSFGVTWEKQWDAKTFHTMPVVLSENKTRFQFGTDTDGSPFFFDIVNRELFVQPEIRTTDRNGNQWAIGNQFIYSYVPIDAKITREPDESDIGEPDFTSQKKVSIDRIFKSGLIAPYAKYTHNWNQQFKTSLGMRYSYAKVTGGAEFQALLPRFNFEYEFYPDTWFTGAWGKYVQLPRGSELAVGTGNPDLSYNKAEHRILGLRHEPDETWTYQLEVFQKPMIDLVLPIDANDPPDNYRNAGKGEAYGLDLLIKHNLTSGMTSWLSYSYIRAKRTDLDGVTRPFSGDQPHTLNLLWSQRLKNSWKKWTVGFRFQWHSGTPYDPIIGTVDVPVDGGGTRPVPVYPSTKNSERLPDFYQLDFRAERRFLFNTWKMNFYIDILNVLNTQNVTDYDYGDNYENIDNPQPVSSSVLFPAFGLEAQF
jgi:hypothetical protein